MCPQCDCDTWNLKRRDLRSLCVTSTIKMLYLYLRELQVSLYKRFPRPSQFNEFASRVLYFPAAPCDFCHNCHKWLRQVQTKLHIAYSIRKSKENGSLPRVSRVLKQWDSQSANIGCDAVYQFQGCLNMRRIQFEISCSPNKALHSLLSNLGQYYFLVQHSAPTMVTNPSIALVRYADSFMFFSSQGKRNI